MMQQIANFIVDHDPMMVLRRTHDTVRYIRWEWNKDHADPIDAEELRLFLCDEHYGDLTDGKRPLPVGAGTGCEVSMRSCACACCKVRSCWSRAWCRTSVPTAVCSARKGVMRRGCLTGRDDRKSDRFAADERKAGERTGVVNAPVRPTNARSAGIFKGL